MRRRMTLRREKHSTETARLLLALVGGALFVGCTLNPWSEDPSNGDADLSSANVGAPTSAVDQGPQQANVPGGDSAFPTSPAVPVSPGAGVVHVPGAPGLAGPVTVEPVVAPRGADAGAGLEADAGALPGEMVESAPGAGAAPIADGSEASSEGR